MEQNNHDDFGLLYDRYSEKVYHKCISFVKDLDLAQDLAHDVFLKTFLNLSRFNHQSKFSTWLYSLTYNFCIDFVRKNSKVRIEDEDELVNIPQNEDDENEKELLKLRSERLVEVLELIPPGDKAILLMKYQDEMSIHDIQTSMDLAESAVKMRLARAKAKALEVYRKSYSDE